MSKAGMVPNSSQNSTNTVFQFTAIFICHRKQFPAEGLDHKTRHKILAGIFFGEDEENSGLSAGEGIRR